MQENPDNSDAWLALGLAHADNDEDVKAIIALNRAVEVQCVVMCCRGGCSGL